MEQYNVVLLLVLATLTSGYVDIYEDTTQKPVDFEYVNWMKDLHPKLSVFQLTVPGTYHSMAYQFNESHQPFLEHRFRLKPGDLAAMFAKGEERVKADRELDHNNTLLMDQVRELQNELNLAAIEIEDKENQIKKSNKNIHGYNLKLQDAHNKMTEMALKIGDTISDNSELRKHVKTLQNDAKSAQTRHKQLIEGTGQKYEKLISDLRAEQAELTQQIENHNNSPNFPNTNSDVVNYNDADHSLRQLIADRSRNEQLINQLLLQAHRDRTSNPQWDPWADNGQHFRKKRELTNDTELAEFETVEDVETEEERDFHFKIIRTQIEGGFLRRDHILRYESEHNLEYQLNNGIRYFYFYVAPLDGVMHIVDSYMWYRHGYPMWSLNATLNQVLDTMTTFLQQHPSEFLFIRLMSKESYPLITSTLNAYKEFFINDYTDRPPTVKQARGKILIWGCALMPTKHNQWGYGTIMKLDGWNMNTTGMTCEWGIDENTNRMINTVEECRGGNLDVFGAQSPNSDDDHHYGRVLFDKYDLSQIYGHFYTCWANTESTKDTTERRINSSWAAPAYYSRTPSNLTRPMIEVSISIHTFILGRYYYSILKPMPGHRALALGDPAVTGMWKGMNEEFMMPVLQRALSETNRISHDAANPVPKFDYLGMVATNYIFNTKGLVRDLIRLNYETMNTRLVNEYTSKFLYEYDFFRIVDESD